MATSLPPLKGTEDKNAAPPTAPEKASVAAPPPRVKSVVATRREIADGVVESIEAAREGPDSWAYEQLMYKMKARDDMKRLRNQEAAKGQSFLRENAEQAEGRHVPATKLHLLALKSERERVHANAVARRRYEGAAQGLLQANVRTSLHRNVAFERDRALRQWVLDVASHNSTSLARRWVGVVTLASKTQALGRRLKRMRDVRRAQNMFFAVALLAGRLHTKFHALRQRSSADRLAAFLRMQAVNGKWNKWILCFERAKRCVIRCQAMWRAKLVCRAAHCAVIAHQWRRHEEALQLAATASSSNSTLRVQKASDEKVAKEARLWVRDRVQEHAVALALWEKYELLPLLRATVKAHPRLVLLDLTSPTSWPAKRPTKVNPLKAYLEKAHAAAAARAAEAAGPPRRNTHEESLRARKRWRYAFHVVYALRAFQSMGFYAPKGQLSERGEAFVAQVRSLCRMAPFVEKWGQLNTIPPAPRLLRVMTTKQLGRFGEAVRS